MKSSILSLSLALLAGVGAGIGAVPAPAAQDEYVPARGNLRSGPADPLTLGMRVEASRQKKYGDRKSSNIQSKIASPQINAASSGCGNACNSTLSFAGSVSMADAMNLLELPPRIIPAAKPFQVGNQIPSVGFSTKTSWAGNIPIATSKARELFFWLWGAETPSDDLVIWLNGGGFLQENGPISYLPGTSAPIDSSKTTSWTQEANVLYIEQPVGTGFTVGSPYAKNEDDVAAAVSGFLDNFYQTFPEMQSKKLWITGESYAGTYIPYIANALYKQGNKHNLQGVWIIDGVIVDEDLLNYAVTSDFVATNNDKYLHLTASQVKKINDEAVRCGLGIGKNSYVSKNLNYPPKGPLPAFSHNCRTFDYYYDAAQTQNSAFNIYDISQQVEPNPPSVLGDPNDPNQANKATFFDNKDLQKYIHAPQKKWNLCNQGVFPNGDGSPTPDKTVLTSVIDSAPSKRNIVSNGNLDGLIMTNGTALGLQNITWGGARGFTKPPLTPLIDTQGNHAGDFVTERGLTFNTVYLAGHEIPEYTPYAGLKLLQYLLGKTANLGA